MAKMRNSLLVLLVFFLFLVSSESIQEQQPILPLHMKLKTLLTNVQSYFFPPNLEGSVNSDEPTVAGGGEAEGGTGEKVKEAVVKSLGKGKATVEQTAKTAAEKLKETFTTHIHEPHEPQKDL